MITFNLKKYVDNSKLSINRLSKITGISRPTLTSMYNGNSKGIQYDTLETLCTFFNIGVADLIVLKIPKEKFDFIELSGKNINTDENRIVGIKYERELNKKLDYEVAIFVFSLKVLKSLKKIRTEKNNPSFEESNSADARTHFSCSLEWITKEDSTTLKNVINQALLNEISDNNMLMNFGETIALYRSLSKELLAYLGSRIIMNFISNSNIKIDSNEEYVISLNWNLGSESALNSDRYHFEYMMKKNLFISLDEDADGIEQQLEHEHVKESDDIKRISRPNWYKLTNNHKDK